MGMGHRFRRNCIYPLKTKNNLDTLCEEYLDYDFYVDDKAMNFLNDKFINQNTFLVFNHIDHLGHYKGVNSDDYKKSVKHLFDKLEQFLDTNKCEILLFSDHGMSVRPKKTSLVLEDYFGKQSLDKYNYFIDSTTLRVWVYDDLLKEKIIQTLSKKKYGLIIDDKKRKEYGIANPKFGHIIFVLSNDYFFEPHYFGFGLKSKTLGMHGNIPTDKWQIGLWMGSEKLPDCFDSRLFYNDIMKKFLKV